MSCELVFRIASRLKNVSLIDKYIGFLDYSSWYQKWVEFGSWDAIIV